jgi:hypothetical protein
MTRKSTFEALQDNMRGWAGRLLREGSPVPLSVLGVRQGAVVTSAVVEVTSAGEGVLDEAVKAAAGWTLSRATSLVVALDTADPRWGVTQRSLVVVSASRAVAAAVVEWGIEVQLGAFEPVEVSELFHELERETSAGAEARVVRSRVEVLDLEERLGMG